MSTDPNAVIRTDPGLRGRQWVLILIGLLGAAAFATVFSFTYSIPGWVEDYGREFIERKARERMETTIDNLAAVDLPGSDSTLGQLAQTLYDKNEARIASLKTALKEQVAERYAAAIARIRDLDCECRVQWAERIREGFEFEIGMLQAANDRVVDFIQGTYMKVTAELRRDIRIFTGTNTAVFLLLVLVAATRRRAARHLMLPAVLLVCATLICSYFYVFQQDWLLTIIYGDYTGLAYLVYLGIVFAILMDIVLNRGRITAEILNGIFNALGSAVSIGPC